MAIGLMRMFGFRILENFNYPYVARASASSGGAGTSRCRTGFAITCTCRSAATAAAARARTRTWSIVFVLCGLWHGASWTFVLWGTWHGVFLVLERAGSGARSSAGRIVAHVYTLAVVMRRLGAVSLRHVAHAADYYAALLDYRARIWRGIR